MSECPTGKRTYRTWALATRMAKNTNRDRDGAHVQPYHCKTCSRFHVGGSDFMPVGPRRAGKVRLK